MSDEQQPDSPSNNPYYRPVHRPHKKIKVPFMGGGRERSPREVGRRPAGDYSTEEWGSTWGFRLIAAAVIGILIYGLYTTFSATGKKQPNLVDVPQQIIDMTWDQAEVFKKFSEVSPNEKHFYLVIGREGATKTIDFRNETSGFWDRVDPHNRLNKAPGSLNVSIDAYDNTRDGVVQLKFE